ncbi:MAG: hypothetical protein AAB893_00955 [Patescibacteria group bacterium]
MKLAYTIILSLLLCSAPAVAENKTPAPTVENPEAIVAKSEPLECPHCGAWQISGSTVAGLEGDIILVEDERIVIPGCGVFGYEIMQSTVKPRYTKYNYKLSLLLTQWTASFLCGRKDGDKWEMTIEVSGHFQDGGTASFSLRRDSDSKEMISLDAWNMGREDPCGAGSGYGTTACIVIANTQLFKALSVSAERAFLILLGNKTSKKMPSFNAARFSAGVWKFCENREKNSGGGSWPAAWALSCQRGILHDKLEEFAKWRDCMEKKKYNISLCKFPTENFYRDPKIAAEE